MDECKHDPRLYSGYPVGMYHCPECGEMVIAGEKHPQSVSEFSPHEDVTTFDAIDALENLVIAIQMGWDLDGVVEKAQKLIDKARGEP